MEVLKILIPLSLGLAFVGFLGFVWAVRNKQYDDLEGDGQKILFEDLLKDDSGES